MIEPYFEVDQVKLAAAIEHARPSISRYEERCKSQKLTGEMVIGEWRKEFECPICLLVVDDPTECKNCEAIFCLGCLVKV